MARARGAGLPSARRGCRGGGRGVEPVRREAARVAGLARTARAAAGRPCVGLPRECRSAAEQERFEHQIEAQGWGATTYVGNDTFALLRAGVDAPPGVAVVCGAGINCSGLAADGRMARFAAVGKISGDWGGGDVPRRGGAVVGVARRRRSRTGDGAGGGCCPPTYGLPDMAALVEALHLGRLREERMHDVTPLLFEVAAGGDEVARSVVLRQADEIVALAAVGACVGSICSTSRSTSCWAAGS